MDWVTQYEALEIEVISRVIAKQGSQRTRGLFGETVDYAVYE